MARPEEKTPWATTQASKTEPYPRKNLYFIGQGQDEVYDYLLWRAHVRGYETIDGLHARSSSEVMNDLLKRAFLRDLLDECEAKAFHDWRAGEYERAGLERDDARLGLSAGYHRNLSHARPDDAPADPRFAAFMRARTDVDKPTRSAVWKAQHGVCADCSSRKAKLRPHRIDASHIKPVRDKRRADDFENCLALCRQCHDLRDGKAQQISPGLDRDNDDEAASAGMR